MPPFLETVATPGEPWWVVGLVGPLLAILAWIVKWMGGAIRDAIREGAAAQTESNRRIHEAVTDQTKALQAFIADDRLVQERLISKASAIQEEIRTLQGCHLSSKGASKLEEMAEEKS